MFGVYLMYESYQSYQGARGGDDGQHINFAQSKLHRLSLKDSIYYHPYR